MNRLTQQSQTGKQDPFLLLLLLLVSQLIAGCTQHHAIETPKNPSKKLYGTIEEPGENIIHQYHASTVFASDLDCSKSHNRYAPVNFRVDSVISPAAVLSRQGVTRRDLISQELALSPGDMIELNIENGDGFSGKYILDSSGYINLPYLRPIKLHGLSNYEAAEKIELALIKNEYFQPATTSIHVHVLEWSEIDITVMGAVFEPGRKYINAKNSNSRSLDRLNAFGDHSNTRMLSEALRSASGIRPDAKLDQVILIRDGWQVELDLIGIFTGQQVTDVPLIAGDQIVVPSTGCFQRNLVRPSQITPKGFRVFMSNLIIPSASNANGAVGRYSSNLPYGSRLLQVAVSANCVGGTQWTNAPRKVVLASNNPLTGQIQVIERSVEELMRQAHNDLANPYLMPNDAVACYDSDVTNLRDVARGVMEVLSPLRAL